MRTLLLGKSGLSRRVGVFQNASEVKTLWIPNIACTECRAAAASLPS
jgi:hypothetical protein